MRRRSEPRACAVALCGPTPWYSRGCSACLAISLSCNAWPLCTASCYPHTTRTNTYTALTHAVAPSFHSMRAFAWTDFFNWLTLSAPAECVGRFYDRLLLVAFLPLLGLVIITVCSAVSGIVYARRRARIVLDDGGQGSAESPVSCAHTAGRGMLRVLPVVLAILFALVPAVSARIFSTYSCNILGVSADGEEVSYLHVDYSVRCESEYHKETVTLSGWLIALWPIGVSAFFSGVLIASRKPLSFANALWHASSFLHDEYRAPYFYWEYAAGAPDAPCVLGVTHADRGVVLCESRLATGCSSSCAS